MKHIICFFATALLLSACTGAETFLPDTGGTPGVSDVPLSIEGLDMSVETRAIKDAVGDDVETNPNHLKKIGVLVTKQVSGQAAPYSSTVGSQTFTYTSANSGKWTPDHVLNLTDAEGTLYAWAPASYTSELSSGVPQMKQVKVLAEQQVVAGSNEWNTDQEDMLYGSAAATVGDATQPKVSRTAAEVSNLYMQHALAKVSFRVWKADGQSVNAADYVKKIELGSAGNAFLTAPSPEATVMMKLADGSMTGLKATEVLTFNMTTQAQVTVYSADFSNITNAQAYGLVAPGTIGAMSVKLTMGPTGALDATTDRTYQSKNNISDVTWEKGKHYLYRMTVSDQGLEILNVQVVGWTDGATVDVPVE